MAWLAALAAACGPAAPPATPWLRLADGSHPRTLARARTKAPGTVAGRTVRFAREGDEVWLETVLTREHWSPADRPHTWIASVPTRSIGRPPAGTPPQRLEGAGHTYRFAGERDEQGDYRITPGCFLAAFGFVQLVLEEGEEPPVELRLRFYARHGTWSAAGARVGGRRYSGEGLAVHAGDRVDIEADVPPDSVLRFATALEPAFRQELDEPTLFRVRLDDEPIFEQALTAGEEGAAVWHEVALPAAGARGAHVSFEVDGQFAFSSFLAPVIGPAEVGSYGARPGPAATERRPDIVVFLVDTLRADCLTSFGGPLELTPNLDRLAGESLRFPRARSVSSWTLPAHASLFTGLQPHQTGAVDSGAVLPDELVTIAELLARRGYRTGAVTEGAFVSQRHGLDQGFQWFAEHQDEIENTFAEARRFLDADDGRPVFLFVHTYKVHSPYECSEETRRRYRDVLRLDFPEDHDTLKARWLEQRDDPRDRTEDKLHRLYLAGVADMDRAFGGFRDALDALGILEHGWLIVTSDHGEVFGEHDELYHSGTVYEEAVRIPLMLHGPGLEPGANEHPASLVDLAPTLADLAGAEPDPAWSGMSLLSLDRDRAVYAFQCLDSSGPSSLAVIEGEHKIIGYDRPPASDTDGLFAAFHLGRDPDETEDLSRTDVGWPSDMLRRHAADLQRFLRPLGARQETALDPEHRREMEALGYGGG